MKNVGNSSRGRSQGVPKIFRAPIYRAHRAVIFATAQLSCYFRAYQRQWKGRQIIRRKVRKLDHRSVAKTLVILCK